jgi:hypothetical protein
VTKPSDRDVDRLLKSTRLPPPTAGSDVCLDAETIAAWMDGTLSAAEVAAAERHAADCIWCQGVLTALVRTMPFDAAPTPRWSAWRVVRWAVPLTAAAAVALWFAVDRNVAESPASESVLSAPSPSAVSQGPSGTPIELAPPSSAATESASARSTPAAPIDAARSADAATPQARAERGARKEAPARSPLQDLAARKDVPSQPVPYETGQRAATVPPATPLPATEADRQPEVKALPPSAAASPPPPSLAETVGVPQAQQAGADARSAGPSQAGLRQQVVQRRARIWTDVPSPDPLVKWRFAAGAVQRSTDGGVTWTHESVGTPASIVAGAAPSSSACWLIGRAGLVLRFTTARGWQRLTIPNAPDLVAVEAKDADNATVTLANGQRLTTVDRGATWR